MNNIFKNTDKSDKWVLLIVFVLGIVSIVLYFIGILCSWKEDFKTLFLAGGTSFTIAFIVDLFHLFQTDNIKKLKEELSEQSTKLQNNILLIEGRKCEFCENSIEHVYLNRESCNLGQYINDSKSEIRFLVTNLYSFLPYYKEIMNALKRIDITILTLDPTEPETRIFLESRFANSDIVNNALSDMQSSLDTFKGLQKTYDNLKIMFYKRSTPSLILIMNNEKCYVSFLMDHIKSRDTLHLCIKNRRFNLDELRNNNDLYGMYSGHYESIKENLGD